MIDNRYILEEATRKVNGITPSVVALAVASGVTPAKFAAVLADEGTQSDFMLSLHAEFAKIRIKQEAEANKSKKTK